MPTTTATIKPFVICKASAGSGKTFNLVLRYLQLALSAGEEGVNSRFRSILAITFTNKAANEMKARILTSLAAIAEYGVEAPMGGALLAALNDMPSFPRRPLDGARLATLAATLHSAILHRYADLSVCTIDSFMHRIVRTFAHDLGQSPSFEVMVEQNELREKAVSQLIALVGTEGNEDLTRALEQFAVSRMEEGKGFEVSSSLYDLSEQLFSEASAEPLRRLARLSMSDFTSLHRTLTHANRAYEQQLAAIGREAIELLAEAGILAEQCDYGRNGFYGYFSRLASGTIAQPTARTRAVFEDSDYCGARFCKGRKVLPGADAIAPRLLALYHEAERLTAVPLVDYNTRKLVLQNLFSLALLGQLDMQLHSYTRENEILHLSDFNKLIAGVVEQSPTPFLYERLGSRYRHFLIDEFQDTSVLQWHNLVPLLDNGVSQGYRSLVVGDAKQAIYRFRQGDVRQFVALPAIDGLAHPALALTDPRNCEEVVLDMNYRTAPAVVDFNNRFFSWALRNRFGDVSLAQRIYVGDADTPEGEESLRQKALEGDGHLRGHVEVSFVDNDDSGALCQRVLDTILDLVSNRGYTYSDIMVLARSRRQLAAHSAYILSHSQVPLASAESFYLRNSDAVMALIAGLRLLDNPADRTAAADLLYRLQSLGLLPIDAEECLLQKTNPDIAATLHRAGLTFNAPYLLALSLYDCCEQMVRDLHLDAFDNAYLAALLGKVASFSLHRTRTLAEFLLWFDEHPDLSASTSDELDAVRMLTIHKAKGLESPVVICPFFPTMHHPLNLWVDVAEKVPEASLPVAYLSLPKDTPSRFDTDRQCEVESETVDDLNLLYVAFTRPKEQLFAFAAVPKASSGETSYARLLYDFCRDTSHYGDPDIVHKKEIPTSSSTVAIHTLSYADWATKVQVASPAEHALTPMVEEKIRFGIYVHEFFAAIRYPDDIDTALTVLAASNTISDQEISDLAQLARAVISHPSTARFFNPAYTVKNECDITDGRQTFRPDRIVITPTETWVVDFKTGVDLGEQHDKQVLSYCNVLAAMGYPCVSGWLLYLTPELRLRQV